MKLVVLTTQLGGTGGALNCINITNKFVEEGHEVKIYSEQAPDRNIKALMKAEVSDLDLLNINSDAIIAFNLTDKIKPILLSAKGKKFARLGIIVPEYDDIMRESSITKITTTTYEKRYVEIYNKNSVISIPGPVDTTNFYRENLIDRTDNMILTYIKKSGWVGISAINQAQDFDRNLIFTNLSPDGIDSCPIRSRYPILILGCNAHLRYYMRYCYNKAAVFVDTHSNGLWGWNCTVAEAMLCKCPVVATDSPVFNDIIISNITALTSPHNEAREIPSQDWKTRPNPERISEHILTIINNKKMARNLAENAYETVKKFDINFWYSEFMRLV